VNATNNITFKQNGWQNERGYKVVPWRKSIIFGGNCEEVDQMELF
jgi:hypothetical protein